MRHPPKNSIYWDMNIPTQFYEEEYLEFKRYLEFTQVKKLSTDENPHANSEYYLQQFEMYEKFCKAEDKKLKKSREKEVKVKKEVVRMKTPAANQECDEEESFLDCPEDVKESMVNMDYFL